MSELFGIIIAGVLTHNILLTGFLGMCSFIAISRDLRASVGLGLAVTFVSTFTAGLNALIYRYFLAPGALVWLFGDSVRSTDLSFVSLIVFIAVIAGFVQVVEMIVQRWFPVLHGVLGIFLPLITVNCAILGVSLFMVIKDFTPFRATVYGFASGAGWALAIVLMAAMRRRLDRAALPRGFDGVPVTLLLTGMLAAAFSAFAGIRL